VSQTRPRRRVGRHFEYEYSGEIFTQAAAKRWMAKAERYYKWAEDQLS
jgi:hypothetical protein